MSIIQILELGTKSGMLVFASMVLMLGIMILPFAFAQPVLISVVQSDACKKSITCLPLSDLIQLDTTDQRISGKMYDDYRSKPYFKNHWEFYKFDKRPYVVCVDCDLGFQGRSKVITIESSASFKYVLQKDNRIINNTFYEYNGRFIQDCQAATVSSDWALINDTVSFMGNNCKVPSKYNEKDTIIKPKTRHTDCSYACLHDKFMKEAKEKVKAGGYLIKPDIKLKKSNDKVKLN